MSADILSARWIGSDIDAAVAYPARTSCGYIGRSTASTVRGYIAQNPERASRLGEAVLGRRERLWSGLLAHCGLAASFARNAKRKRVCSQPCGFGEVDAKTVPTALIAEGHFRAGMAELLLVIMLVDSATWIPAADVVAFRQGDEEGGQTIHRELVGLFLGGKTGAVNVSCNTSWTCMNSERVRRSTSIYFSCCNDSFWAVSPRAVGGCPFLTSSGWPTLN